MTVIRFEEIHQFLHFNDKPQDHPNHDRFHKVTPIVTHLYAINSTVLVEAQLSTDEQLYSIKVQLYMKQYLPLKPHKW